MPKSPAVFADSPCRESQTILPERAGGQKDNQTMIRLTRLNNHPLTVNSDLIKFVEQSPDTVITLISGEKIVVRESAQEILARVIDFRRSLLQGPSARDESSLPSSAHAGEELKKQDVAAKEPEP